MNLKMTFCIGVY